MKRKQLKQKSQTLISQAGKIQMNTKVNREQTWKRIQNALKNKVAYKQCNA